MTTPTDVVPSCRGINQDHPDSSVPLVSRRGCTYWLSITFKSFYVHGILPVRVGHIRAGVLPITPTGNIVQAFVEFPAVEVACRHDTISARCIDQVVELYSALFPGGVLP